MKESERKSIQKEKNQRKPKKINSKSTRKPKKI